MTVKELIEKLKEFPENMEVLSYEYFSIKDIYEDVYPYIPVNAPKSMSEQKYVIIN